MGTDGLVELTEAQCRDLIATDSVARIAFVTPAGPRIVPVNYALAHPGGHPRLRIRTGSDTELAVYAPGTPVAVEVDHLDGERLRGWSVVVHGTCRRLPQAPVRTPSSREPQPAPWAGAERRDVWLEVGLGDVSGRRVGGIHWPHPVVSGRSRPT